MKKALSIVLSVLMVLSVLTPVALVGAVSDPELTIVAHNLATGDTLSLAYYTVSSDIPGGADRGILVFEGPRARYVYGEEDFLLDDSELMTYGNAGYDVYFLDNIAYERTVDDIYAVPFVKIGDEIFYGKLDKYSILLYCHHMKDNQTEIDGEALSGIVASMRADAAAAQTEKGYRTDNLATDAHVELSLDGGTFADGTASWLLKSGASVRVTAQNPDGLPVIEWTNAAHTVIGAGTSCDVVVPETDATFTAVCTAAGKGLEFTSNGDGTCYVSGIGTCTDTGLNIPRLSPDGDKVTGIGDGAFEDCADLTSVIIPEGVSAIGYRAFYGCGKLAALTLPQGLTVIDGFAFYNCRKLAALTLPAGVTTVGDSAFAFCVALTSLNIPASLTDIGDEAFVGCTGLASITVDAANTVWHSAGNCLIKTAANTLVLGCKNSAVPQDGSVTVIGDFAFRNCAGLTAVTLPASLTGIGIGAFDGCTGLASVTVPASVSTVGNGAFKGCSALTIYCEAAAKPAGWHEGWNPDNRPVYWNWSSYSTGLAFTSNGDGTCCVSGIGTCTDTALKIPPVSPDGDAVTGIGDSAFIANNKLTSLVIPDSVTGIGKNAFYRCAALTSVTFGSGLKSIGNSAFFACPNLTSIEIPASVTDIGESVFHFCGSVSSMTVAAGNPVWHSAGNCIIETASKTLLYGCKNSVIPSDGSVTTIGAGAFHGCGGLASVTVPDCVSVLGDAAFDSCAGLTSVTLGSGLTEIGISCFYGCENLTAVTIPACVTTVGYIAFEKCDNLTVYCVAASKPAGWNNDWNPDNRPVIWSCLAYSTGLTFTSNGDGTCKVSGIGTCTDKAVSVPPLSPAGETVTGIGAEAFKNCTGITSVTVPAGVTDIGISAFCGCSGLTSVTLPDTVTGIGTSAFEGCSKLAALTLPGNLTGIGNFAFENCSALTSVTVPNSVTSFGNGVFMSCEGLTSVTVGTGIQNLGDNTFRFCTSLTSAVIPDTVKTIGQFAFGGCTGLTSVTLGSGLTTVGNNAFGGCTGLTGIDIPSGVTGIGNAAFSGCTGLTSVTIPYGVTSIGQGAFRGCTELTSVTIPASVTGIGQDVWTYCGSLSSITVDAGNTVYHSAGNCLIETASKKLIVGCKASVIPTDGSVTAIQNTAFVGFIGLPSTFFIPACVTTVEAGAFWDLPDQVTIYCEAPSKPSGWADSWEDGLGPDTVFWNRTP